MLSTLITSKTRVKLLTLFLTHPDERFYYKNLVERLGAAPSAVQSELKRLESVGLLQSRREGNIRFYWVNRDFPLFPELKTMVFKTVGLADHLSGALSRIGTIESAFIYGSVAKNLEDMRSDVDLMVIGDIDMDALYDTVNEAENSIGREINVTAFGADEWRDNLRRRTAFAANVREDKKIFLVGGEEDLERVGRGQ